LNKKLKKRFDELYEQMEEVNKTKKLSHSEMMGSFENVDDNAFLELKVKVKNLIVKVSGENSQHFKELIKAEGKSSYSGSYSKFQAFRAIFLATKEDFEGGYLSSYKSIVQAEVFDTELEQAQELLNSGYYVAAAIIACVVLETTLRELCDREDIQYSKLDKMNSDLAKAGVYNKIVQKQITAHAGIRNSAAHGNKNEFTKEDVEQMLPAIEQFLVTHLDE